MNDEDLREIAKIVYAEGSVFIDENDAALVAIAQCAHDLYETGDYKDVHDCLSKCFTTPSDIVDEKCLAAVEAVFEKGTRRFDNAKIYQFRSFQNYSDGHGNLNTAKTQQLLTEYDYLGSDSISDRWGHFYFGKDLNMRNKLKMMIISGHGEGDCGAVGCGYKEADLTRELAKLVYSEAQNKGIDVTLYDQNKNAYKRIGANERINVIGYDYVFEIHFNASSTVDYNGDGKKKGTMFYLHKEEAGHSVEDKILNNLYALGSVQAWDGIVVTQRQWSTGLRVQNHIISQGVSHALLETCFISDKDDMNWYQTNKNKIAKAIVQGIVDGFGFKPSAATTPFLVKVTDPCLNIRAGAGTNYTINGQITDKGTYTIVQTSAGAGSTAGWGELKSGAGWISLDFVKRV